MARWQPKSTKSASVRPGYGVVCTVGDTRDARWFDRSDGVRPERWENGWPRSSRDSRNFRLEAALAVHRQQPLPLWKTGVG